MYCIVMILFDFSPVVLFVICSFAVVPATISFMGKGVVDGIGLNYFFYYRDLLSVFPDYIGSFIGALRVSPKVVHLFLQSGIQ
jgi:hypothetical protein